MALRYGSSLSSCFASIVLTEVLIRLKWEPVVLTFSFSSRETKAGDPLAKMCSKLENLDIKTVGPYVVGKTTHAVQSKRNTAKGLQALINGKPIVQDSYIDALIYATTPTNSENEEALSPLEADFESAWPDPAGYLPPPANEPNPRAAADFAPRSGRASVFEGFTFVFGDPTQFETLQPVINNGQGKALHYQIQDGVTTADELVQFMREAAGLKGRRRADEDLGKVVLVRFRSKGEHENWSIELSHTIARTLDRRVIEQKEFLNAILDCDASPLCRPLPSEEGSSQSEIPEAAPEPSTTRRIVDAGDDAPPTQPPPPSQEPMASSKKKAPKVRKFVSKMKNFDDGFDMDSIPVYDVDGPESTEMQQVESEVQPSQKAEPLQSIEEEEDATTEDLFPGARAMKRRREEIEQGRQTSRAPPTDSMAAPKPKRAKLDVLEAARKHREEEEQLKREEEEARRSQDVNVEELRNLAIVEEMDMPVRETPTRTEQTSDRWDDQWNGRKNFKRFRRKGEPRNARQRIQSVIVPLEEVTKKSFGVGEHYWVSTDKSPAREAEPVEDQEPESTAATNESVTMGSQPVVEELFDSPEPTPEPQPVPSRSRPQKRPREVRDSDSDDDTRFRFRRKR